MDIKLVSFRVFRRIERKLAALHEKEVNAFFVKRGYVPEEGEKPVGVLPVRLRALLFLCYKEHEEFFPEGNTILTVPDPDFLDSVEEEAPAGKSFLLLDFYESEMRNIFPGIERVDSRFSADFKIYVSEDESGFGSEEGLGGKQKVHPNPATVH